MKKRRNITEFDQRPPPSLATDSHIFLSCALFWNALLWLDTDHSTSICDECRTDQTWQIKIIKQLMDPPIHPIDLGLKKWDSGLKKWICWKYLTKIVKYAFPFTVMERAYTKFTIVNETDKNTWRWKGHPRYIEHNALQWKMIRHIWHQRWQLLDHPVHPLLFSISDDWMLF